MPVCSQCGHTIDCPNHAHVVGSVSQPCPLKRGAVWIWVVDESDGNVEGASVTFNGRPGTTDASGVAAFDPVTVQDDPYDVAVTAVPSTRDKTHALPTAATGAVTAAQGQIVTKKFTLRTLRPKLAVVDRHDFKKVVGASHKHTLVLKNEGDGELTLGAITFPTHFKADDTNAVTTGATIAVGHEAELKIEYTPGAVGEHSGDLTLASNDAASPKSVALHGELVKPAFELFRGTGVLPLVPFATTDVAEHLDGALPDTDHGVDGDTRDPSLDAAFTFPLKTDYATNVHADADPSVFRLRLKGMPDGAPDEVAVVVKVLKASGVALPGVAGFANAGTAGVAAGMPVTFKKNGAVWESPYLRVATTVTDLSKGATAMVHSSYAATIADAANAKQFGRVLEAKATVLGEAVAGEYPMGGDPWARVPVRFCAVGWAGGVLKPLVKLAELNQYWAGQGLEFKLHDPLAPLAQLVAPPRLLLTLNEHTGDALFTDHDVRVEVTVSFSIGGQDVDAAVTADVPAAETPSQAAARIKTALGAWRGGGAASAVRLDADVFDFAAPRVVLTGPGPTPPADLTAIGARGPTDLTVKETTGAAVTNLRITRVAATREVTTSTPDPTGNGPPTVTVARVADTSVDAFSPPVAQAYHDPVCNPPSAAMRAWVRAFGSPGRDAVTVLISDRVGEQSLTALCEAGLSTLYDANVDTLKGRMAPELANLASSTSPISILNFGRWTEPQAHFVIFLGRGNFSAGSNDLQHEVGHTLVDCNHTLSEPSWFYKYELMHASGPPMGKANRMTRHKIKVDTALNAGGWKSDYIVLAEGYGGAARARITRLAPQWCTGATDFPWS